MGTGLQTDAHHGIDGEYEYGGRNHDKGVDPELIAHLAVLGLGSYYRGIGDEREVVAEVSTTNDDSCHHAYVYVHGVGKSRSYRNKSHNGPTLVPMDTEMKAGSQEQSGRIMLAGRILSARLTVASTAPIALARSSEGACQYVNPEHEHQVVGAGTLAIGIYIRLF